jgi:hypothetical protein
MQIHGFLGPFLAIVINFLKSRTEIDFPKYSYSKFISNMKKFIWRKLFISSNPSKPYFILNFGARKGPLLIESISNQFGHLI